MSGILWLLATGAVLVSQFGAVDYHPVAHFVGRQGSFTGLVFRTTGAGFALAVGDLVAGAFVERCFYFACEQAGGETGHGASRFRFLRIGDPAAGHPSLSLLVFLFGHACGIRLFGGVRIRLGVIVAIVIAVIIISISIPIPIVISVIITVIITVIIIIIRWRRGRRCATGRRS